MSFVGNLGGGYCFAPPPPPKFLIFLTQKKDLNFISSTSFASRFNVCPQGNVERAVTIKSDQTLFRIIENLLVLGPSRSCSLAIITNKERCTNDANRVK